MKRMIRTACLAGLCALLAAPGCVRVRQVVKMNHDGSGTLTETITVLPRAVRMLKGHAKRSGKGDGGFILLTKEALDQRTKHFGQVTLKSKEEKTLPDGSRFLKTVFEFKDVNKIRLCVAPTFQCTSPGRKGTLQLRYRRIVRGPGRSAKYYKRDALSVTYSRYPSQRKSSSPEIQQKYRDATPIFQDMLRDFHFEIRIQAPDDVETFDDKRQMVRNMPFDRNEVIPYRVDGRDVAATPELVRGLLMGEMGGRSDAWGGQWRRMELSMPGTHTPYGAGYHGMNVQFFKAVEVPNPGSKEEK